MDTKLTIWLAVVALGVAVIVTMFQGSLLFLNLSIFAVALYIAYRVPDITQRFRKWRRTPDRENIRLSPDKIDFISNKYDLLITNNEWRKKHLTIDEVKVWRGKWLRFEKS